MAGGIFDRLLGRLRTVSESAGIGSDLPVGTITHYFERLAKVDRKLPAAAARYVAEGDNPSIILTLQTASTQQLWRNTYRPWPDGGGKALFHDLRKWRSDQMQRLGEIMTALNPLTHDWGHFGTRKSPDWLRHTVTLWLGRDKKDQPIAVLGDLAALTGDPVGPVLDILFARDPYIYGVSNSAGRFAGLGAWLTASEGAIIAAAPALGADVRAELAASLGRLGLQNTFRDLLIDLACGPAKTVRTSARQALTACAKPPLAAALEERFAKAAPGAKVELVAVAAGCLGAEAEALLARWRTSESAAKVIAALDQASGTMGLPPVPQAPAAAPGTPAALYALPAQDDGPEGYTAVDGSWVDAGGPLVLPGPSPVPPEVLALLEPAVDAFNRALAKGKAEAVRERWHWSKQLHTKDSGTLKAIARLAEGTSPLVQGSYRPAVDWLNVQQFRHPAVDAFFGDPRLTLRHLVRLGLAMSNSYLYHLLSDYSGAVGRAVRARLADPDGLRVFLGLWREASGKDLVTEQLQNRWSWGGLPDFGGPVWPLLCTRFADLDEALGLAPQSGTEPKLAVRGLEMLEHFPILPARYRNRMMALAADSSARTRDKARALLKDTAGIDAAIAVQLGDGKQDTRALAADWLAARGATDQVPAIRAALKKEKSDIARAAMITALEQLGDDVSDLFDPDLLIKEAKAGLAKTSPKGLDWFPFAMIPQLHWADSTPLDPLLPRWWVTLAAKLKQPGGNALINLWLDRLAPGDAHKLGWMVLTGWIDEDTRRPSDEEANAYAAQNVDAVLKANIANAKRWPQSADYFPTDRGIVFARLKRDKAGIYLGSAADSKGILALAARVNGADAAARIGPYLKNHGSRTSQAKALLEVLAAIGTSSALQALLGAANRMKQRSVQDFAGKLVDEIAARNGWTPAQLADRTVPTGGFDADGTQELDLGPDRTYRLQLGADDGIVILNPDGREVKALPAARVDEEKPQVDAAKKQLANARKEVKQVLAAQAARLQEAMFLQREWDAAEWGSFIAGHALVGRLAARLVWQGLNADSAALALFRPLGDGSFTDPDDGDVSLEDFARIRLAHASLIAGEDIARWRQHLADYAVEPPFDQLGRDLPELNIAQTKQTAITDREGWMVETFKLRGMATKRGYQRGPAQDGGWFMTYEKLFRDAAVMVEIEFTGSPLPEENQNGALVSLSFRRLRGTVGGAAIPLGEVPPVLLAESWCDLHEIAGKGTGFDPEWKKKTGYG